MTHRLLQYCLLAVLACSFARVPIFCQDLDYPLAVVVSHDGTVYVADRDLPGIWQIKDGKAQVYFQASQEFRTPLNAIRCLAIDKQGHLLAGDSSTRDVYRFDSNARPVSLAGGKVGMPMAIAVNGNNEILVADLESQSILMLAATGGTPVAFAAVPAPRGIAIDAQERVWVVSHAKEQLIRLVDRETSQSLVDGSVFQFAHQVAVDATGDAYVADGYGACIWKIPKDGKPTRLFRGEPMQSPVGIYVDEDRLLIADPRAKTIFVGNLAGGKLRTLLQL